MSQILVGTTANDGTGDPLRTAFQKLNQAMYECYNVRSYGARGDGATDDTTAIQAAIDAAATTSTGTRGAVVYFPTGIYAVSAALVIPIALNDQAVILRGAGMRAATIQPTGAASNYPAGVVRFGSATADPSGTSNFITQYCGMEDLGVNGTGLTGVGTGIGVQMTETQYCWMNNVLIQNFTTGSSIGLYLKGSTTTGAGAAAAPHVWRCNFTNVVATNAVRPLVCENADECGFYHCNFALVTSSSSAVIAAELIQFHSLRFYDLLLSGDNQAAFRANYTGLKMNSPVNGDCINLQVYGLVVEGFDVGVLFGGGSGQDAWIYGYNAAESTAPTAGNRKAFNNGADDGGAERRNNVHIFMAGSAQVTGVPDYHTGQEPEPEALTLIMNGGGNFTPEIRGGNTFATSANTGGSAITDFIERGGAAASGRTITVRLDANVKITHNASFIRCPGAADVTAAAHKIVTLKRLGGIWYVTSVVTDA